MNTERIQQYDDLTHKSLKILAALVNNNPKMYPKFSIAHAGERGYVFFTGWKLCINPFDGAVAQFLDYRDLNNLRYCNIPNLTCDFYYAGQSFDIGTERIWSDIDDERLQEIIIAGINKLYQKG